MGISGNIEVKHISSKWLKLNVYPPPPPQPHPPFKPDSKNSVSHKSYICTEANFNSFINWYLSVDIHNVLGIAF